MSFKIGAAFAAGDFQQFTTIGFVQEISPDKSQYNLGLLTGEVICVRVSLTARYEVLRNIGQWPENDVGRHFIEEIESILETNSAGMVYSEEENSSNIRHALAHRLAVGQLVCMQGTRSRWRDRTDYEARRLVLLQSEPAIAHWEANNWWPYQSKALVEPMLEVLFRDQTDITDNNFAEVYRSNLQRLGHSDPNLTQERGTLSRFLFGLSSAFLLTGDRRALAAARASARYLINTCSELRDGARYCLWRFTPTPAATTEEHTVEGAAYSLYEQIYAISGLAQYYRISQDSWVLGYIAHTVETFQQLFLDNSVRHSAGDSCFTGLGGYFSHIDAVTLRPDSASLLASGNSRRKNWNSVGDHIPGYLTNVLLALDPLPLCGPGSEYILATRDLCRGILAHCADCILEYFDPPAEKGNPSQYIHERFHADWSPDYGWGWQQDRGVIGHNLKISWNLSRCAHYFESLSKRLVSCDATSSDAYATRARRCRDFAVKLGERMINHGIDLMRGGVFDAVERHPTNGLPIQFAFDSTKDYWQQEQAILAYYIMHGFEYASGATSLPRSPSFLDVARICGAFWNLFFLDHEHRKVFFRTNESGTPITSGLVQKGHAADGYHPFELCYFAQIYTQAYARDDSSPNASFILYFCPSGAPGISTLNVQPDFLPPDTVAISQVSFNGISQSAAPVNGFLIDISGLSPNTVIEVEFCCRRKFSKASAVNPGIQARA